MSEAGSEAEPPNALETSITIDAAGVTPEVKVAFRSLLNGIKDLKLFYKDLLLKIKKLEKAARCSAPTPTFRDNPGLAEKVVTLTSKVTEL